MKTSLLILLVSYTCKSRFESRIGTARRAMNQEQTADDGFEVVQNNRKQHKQRRNNQGSTKNDRRPQNTHQANNRNGSGQRKPNDRNSNKPARPRFPPFLKHVQIPSKPVSTAEEAASLGWPDPAQATKPCMLVLLGKPGSGKSTFSQKLESLLPDNYVRINQDEMGNRKRCISKTVGVLKGDRATPIIDRCNVSRDQRAYFLDLAREHGNLPVDLIWFQFDTDTLTRRCQTRGRHPTLHPKQVPSVLAMMEKDFQPPYPREGFRSCHIVRDEKSLVSVLQLYVNRVFVTSPLADPCDDLLPLVSNEDPSPMSEETETDRNNRTSLVEIKTEVL